MILNHPHAYLGFLQQQQIKVMHYRDLEARLAAADPEYVPRAPHYRRHLWAHLDTWLGGLGK